MNSQSVIVASVITSALCAPIAVAQDKEGYFERLEVQPVFEQSNPDVDQKPIPSDGFLFKPELVFSIGRESNVLANDLNEQEDSFVGFSPSLSIESDWSRHALSGSIVVDHVEYGELEQESRTNSEVKLRGRLDVNNQTRLFVAVVNEDLTEDRASVSAVPNSLEPNEYTRSGAEFGFVSEVGRISLEAAIALDSFDYDDVEIPGDLIQDQDFRDHEELVGSARIKFALNRDVALYTDIKAVQSFYDEPNIFNPFERDYTGVTALAGTDFAIGSKISGDIGIGYLNYVYDYEFSEDISDFAFTGHLDWQLADQTTLSLAADRAVIDPGVVSSNAAIQTDAGIRVEQGLTPKFSVAGEAGFTQYAFESIDRDDDRIDLGINALWKLNKGVWFEGGYDFIEQTSDIQPFTDNRFLLKMRIFP
ncbi:MAG: outer membrane beta-barrel protein [Pseudomonadota bacterium]